MTETVAALEGLDPYADSNAIHDVLLTDEPLDQAELMDAAPAANRRRQDYALNLGTLPPLTSVTVTLTLRLIALIAGFTELDGGAMVWDILQGRAVNSTAPMIILAPASADGEALSDWLKWTLDADTSDAYMLAQAARLSQDPRRMFAFVRALGYESYSGSLRGTLGTLWSAAGSSLDRSRLLIGMLRASAIPARYRHGRLSQAQAQVLIRSMFPTPTELRGHLPPGSQLSNLANDARLLREVQDHWWVERVSLVKAGATWIPRLPPPRSGRVLSRPTISPPMTPDQITEVPDAPRHKVMLKVKVEQMQPLNVGSNGLDHIYPLATALNAVELVGNPLTLGHFVNSTGEAGVFYNIQHTYTPYLRVGDQIIKGQPFQDLRSNFPLGSMFVTDEWLLVEVSGPGVPTTTLTREVVDKIGVENWAGGGTLNLGQNLGTDPLFLLFDLVTLTVGPSKPKLNALKAQVAPQLVRSLQQRRIRFGADLPCSHVPGRPVASLLRAEISYTDNQ